MEQIKKFILKGDKLVKKTFQNLKMLKKMIIINIKEMKKKNILKKKLKVVMIIQ